MPTLIIILAIWLWGVSSVQAATVSALTCNQTDVLNAIKAAADGDTVHIPAGSCTWITQLKLSIPGKALDIECDPDTTIIDGIDKPACTSNPSLDCGKAEHILLHLYDIQKRFRFRGCRIEGDPAFPNDNNNQPMIRLVANTSNFRLHDNLLTSYRSGVLQVDGNVQGVIDQNTFTYPRNGGAVKSWQSTWGGTACNMTNYGKSFCDYGDGSWWLPSSLGGSEALFLEDNIFNGNGSAGGDTVVDCKEGDRIVVRYNTINSSFVGSHGTENDRKRGCRQFEVYENTFTQLRTGRITTAVNIRGGTGVIFNNTIENNGPNGTNDYGKTATLKTYRCSEWGAFSPTGAADWQGLCDGDSPYDGNQYGTIGSPCIDGVGRGSGDLLRWSANDGPSLPPTWPNQPSDPVHIWGNSFTLVQLGGEDARKCIIRGTDVVIGTPKPGYVQYTYPHPLREIAPDTNAPTAPTSLNVTAISASQINASWTAATDDIGVSSYRVERCQGSLCMTFVQVGSTSATSFSDTTGLAPNTLYRYRVFALDAAGNVSPESNTAQATTLPQTDTTPPTVPSGLVATAVSPSQIDLEWTASTDAVGVTEYLLERCQGSGCTTFAQIATVDGTLPDPTWSDANLSASTLYRYQVKARDAAGNTSAASTIAEATTQASPDTTAPTVPGSFTATAVSSEQITLSWSASTDAVGVTVYRLERCEGAGCTTWAEVALITGTPPATTYANGFLTASTLYRYRLRAQDAAGNLSGYSTIAEATTQAFVPPTVRALLLPLMRGVWR